MSHIKVLPASVINKIAAGEVIDRPAAVVKELIENAIDAMASKIDTYLEDGGRKMLRVSDDGIGMDAEDLSLAFQSHATSKLLNADDLFAIHTLGFRGEALPSIGAVSRASIISRTQGAIQGAEISIDGGVLSQIKECGAPEGTQVTVKDLFFNVPVRKKFLRTIPTEMAYISEVLTRFAIAYPAIHFTLMHNTRTVFNLPPVRETAERIATFFGDEMNKHLIPVFLREALFSLSGYIAPPFFDKANARMQFIFLNGRYIKDSAIFRAINESYHGKLMHRRYPIVFLFLQVDPSEVDVNVHPTKTEVRFRNTSSIYNYVMAALKEGLHKAAPKPSGIATFAPIPGKESGKADEAGFTKRSLWEPFSYRKTDEIQDTKGNADIPPSGDRIRNLDAFTPFDDRNILSSPPERPCEERGEGVLHAEKSEASVNAQMSKTPEPAGNRSPVEVIGKKKVSFQIHDAFIVEETDDGFNLIDQHALHEIILYHEIERNLQGAQSASQRLLIPEMIELSPKDFFSVTSIKQYLGDLGVEIEEFGQRTIVIRSFPQMLRHLPGKEFIESVLTEFSDEKELKGKDKIVSKLISVMACKGAIKAGQRLEPQEIEELLKMKKDIHAYTNNCPHGRPTTLFFSLCELQKQFKRK